MTTDEQARTSNDNRVRFTIEITPELQQRIERAAAERNQTLQEYAEAMLEQAAPSEHGVPESEQQRQGGISMDAYNGLLALQRKIAEEHPGHVFEDSVDVIRQMREERTQHLESLMHVEHE